MARTSRKGAARQIPAVPAERVWNTAVYTRLSKEDNGLKDGDSLDTQIELVSGYVRQQPHLRLADVYADNGEYSGDFDRPQWNRLMDDIRAGRIDCIAVKDLSRFGRNYIETCEYLEKIFPFMGVRFLSVNDGYDSEIGGTSGLIVSLKNLMNDAYARDISRKCLSSKKSKRERGEFSGAFPPFGYRKSETEKGKLIPDEETAPVIADIFKWKAEGIGNRTICKKLDELGIASPSVRLQEKFYENGHDYFKGFLWQPKTIPQIIARRVYLGHLEQGRTYQARCENAPNKQKLPRSQWCIVENTHEPLVSLELWEAANRVVEERRAEWYGPEPINNHPQNVFSGLLVCGICGGKLSRDFVKSKGKLYYFHECRLVRQHPADRHFRSLSDKIIREAVFPIVKKQLQLTGDMSHVIGKRIKQLGNPQETLERRIAAEHREIGAYNDKLIRLYEDYADRLLNEQEYVRIKRGYEERIDSAKDRIGELERKLSVIGDVDSTANRWLIAARDFRDPKELSRELLTALVDRIVISGADDIEVIWNHRDDLSLLETCAGEEGF